MEVWNLQLQIGNNEIGTYRNMEDLKETKEKENAQSVSLKI